MTAPIYTVANCKAAYQLNWALSLFWHTSVADAAWLPELQAATEADGVRVLEHRFIIMGMRDMIVRAAGKKEHLLSRAGIVPDHVHLAIGCNLAESPAEVALSYMNNLAYACGKKRVFAFGFYVGTFGEYDLGVTWL